MNQKNKVTSMDEKKQKLIDLGTETLAEFLLRLSQRYDFVESEVEQLIATPKESVQ
jgi:hypothetical protein